MSHNLATPTLSQENKKLTLTFPYGFTHLSIDECAAIIAEAEYPKNWHVPDSSLRETDRERKVRQHYWKLELSNACHEEITPYNPDNPMLTETSPMDGRALLSLIEFLNWLSVQALATPIGWVGNALSHKKASHTLLNAFIDQQEAMLERQQEGRYLLEEVAGIICHKFPAEDSKRLLEQLINDATHSALTVYKLGENLKFRPKSKIGLDGLPSLEVVKEWSTEAHWDDLNEWITRELPKLPFRFAEPKSKSGFKQSDAAQMPTDNSTDEAPASERANNSYPQDGRDSEAKLGALSLASIDSDETDSLIRKAGKHAPKIIETIISLGHDPKKLPTRQPGKAGVKSQVRKKHNNLTQKAFDNNWQSLRDNGEIAEE